MDSNFVIAQNKLTNSRKTWLVTGVAGFIGSNLLEALLRMNQKVIGIDNMSTGSLANLLSVEHSVGSGLWRNFEFKFGDITDADLCNTICCGVDHVLHQAALGSVPRSIANPVVTNTANISGHLSMLDASRQAGATFVYAASSSTYGDHPALPKQEDTIGNPLSPYAVTKFVNELYAEVFEKVYSYKSIGLRYFNVFGRRQSSNGAYAAVIPRWIENCLESKTIEIFGDGETSRDFCYIDNAVQANILASLAPTEAWGNVFNVACNARTSLNDVAAKIQSEMKNRGIRSTSKVEYTDFRAGDIKHSQADISKAIAQIGFNPTHSFDDGIKETVDWYLAVNNQSKELNFVANM